MQDLNTLTAHLFRENAGKMTAVLTRIFGLHQIDRVTDIVQDTFETALNKWKYSGIPENPGGWLMQTAKNSAVNTFKRENKTSTISHSAFIKNFDTSLELNIDQLLMPGEIEDSQLRLLLACCHPDFSEKNQVIITLNILSGFGILEIANALLMSEDAVKKALFRTKAELKGMGNILDTPLPLKSEKRVSTVHTILYLMFNEGYKTTHSREIIDHDLCYEAIRLTKLLLKTGIALGEETHALLALMFFSLSRFPSRMSTAGELISLEDQDRSKWNVVFIEEGYFYLNQATGSEKASRYHLEAIIASLHCKAKRFEDTDWKSIVYLYEQLENLCPSPMITLNKLVAESYRSNSEKALAELIKLKADPALRVHHLLYAAEGDMLKRNGQMKEAKAAFSRARELAVSDMDKQFLENKINKC